MLSRWEIGVLSQAFGLGQRQVVDDAKLLSAGRHTPLDDVIAAYRERHHWSAPLAYRYLRTLRTALRGGPISL